MFLARSNGFATNCSILGVSAHRSAGEGGFSVENGNVASFTEGSREVFDLVFNGANIDQSDSNYKTVLEMNASAFGSIERKLGAEEKHRMEEHLSALERIQATLDSGGQDARAIAAKCTKWPATPPALWTTAICW